MYKQFDFNYGKQDKEIREGKNIALLRNRPGPG